MKNMFNVTTVLPHNLLQMNPCIRHNFSTHVFRKRVAQLHYVGSFARGCEAKRWSHWTCSSLGTIFQPMRINSVPDVKCFFLIIKMCYVHNQWYDISCATLYNYVPSVHSKPHEMWLNTYTIFTDCNTSHFLGCHAMQSSKCAPLLPWCLNQQMPV